ncbi:hypothetical protein PS639_02409 [Pseudomonas fluorescens]|nr:hypothetical protein PS639_02409 [Pseudomonas fluorescens]
MELCPIFSPHGVTIDSTMDSMPLNNPAYPP